MIKQADTQNALKIVASDRIKSHISFRYETEVTETDKQLFFCLNPFLNRYALSSGCICSGQDAYKLLCSLLDEGLLSLLSSNPTFSDCIRILSYALGFFSAGDLKYYLGIDGMFLRSFLATTEKTYHNLVRYKLRKNYNNYHYYLYNPALYPFRGWSRAVPSPAAYAGKTISLRSIPHSYSTSLSILMMELWCIQKPAYQFEPHLEVSLGNYKDAPGKHSAEITIDALCILNNRKNNKPQALICLEQDMGTENYSVLLTKLYDYAQTDYFNSQAAENIYILFSCNRLIAARPGGSMYDKKWHIALYVLFRQLLSLQHKGKKLLDANMFSVLPSLEKYLENLCKRGETVALETIYEIGIFPELCQNTLFGVSIQEVGQCLLSLVGKVSDLFTQFLSAIGLYLPGGRAPFIDDDFLTGKNSLPLQVYRDFLLAYPHDTDYLSRISYNKSLYDIAHTRHHGLAHAILSVMLLKRAINTHMDTINRQNSVVFLYAVYQGYSLYTIATPLLSNYMPYLLWDRTSREITYIENNISAYLSADINTFSYSTLSPEMSIGYERLSFTNIREGAYFPKGRFRHYYMSQQIANCQSSTHSFCIEDLDADTGAYCRAYLFLRYYCDPENLHLILLVDAPESALAFYRDIVWGKRLGTFAQSPGCRVSLYAQKNYVEHSLCRHTPQLLFLERGNNLYADKRLFGVSENGDIIYFR